MQGKQTIKLLLADDEPLARQRLTRLINALAEDYLIVAEAGDGQEAVDLAQQHQADIVLLDINMPALDGMAAADALRQLTPAPVLIFVTAYDQHALAAFDKQAVDYLLKPVKLERLQQALNRARQWLPNKKQIIQIKQYNQLYHIELADIYYFRAEQKYVIARCQKNEFLLEQPLIQLEQSHPQFIRIHRNALVASQHLRGIKKIAGKPYVLFNNIDEKLEISRRHLTEIMRFFKNWL